MAPTPPDMSHSDSELNKTNKDVRKKLHIAFKSREFFRAQAKRILKKRLLYAVYTNNTEAVQDYLDSGVSPDCSDVQGRSALHIAASKGYTRVVKLLLAQGANPNPRDKLYNTPLHLAACTHNLSIISLLLKAGADASKLDMYGKNPLQLAKSKLQLLQRGWKTGSIEMSHVLNELRLIVDILISVASPAITDVDELQMMKLSLNSDQPETVEDQMTKLLKELQGINIS